MLITGLCSKHNQTHLHAFTKFECISDRKVYFEKLSIYLASHLWRHCIIIICQIKIFINSSSSSYIIKMFSWFHSKFQTIRQFSILAAGPYFYDLDWFDQLAFISNRSI